MPASLHKSYRFDLAGVVVGATVGATAQIQLPAGRYRLTTTAPIAVRDGSAGAVTDQDYPVRASQPLDLRLRSGSVAVASTTSAPARVWLVPQED